MSSSEADRAAIRVNTETLLSAVINSDAEMAASVWSETGRLMPPHRPTVTGRKAIAAYFRGLFAKQELHFTFTATQLQVSGEMAVERVEYRAIVRSRDGEDTTEDRGKGIHVYRRESDGSWKLSDDIWNSDVMQKK